MPRGVCPAAGASTPTPSARDTSSAKDWTCIFSITLWRWALIVRSLQPNAREACLLVLRIALGGHTAEAAAHANLPPIDGALAIAQGPRRPARDYQPILINQFSHRSWVRTARFSRHPDKATSALEENSLVEGTRSYPSPCFRTIDLGQSSMMQFTAAGTYCCLGTRDDRSPVCTRNGLKPTSLSPVMRRDRPGRIPRCRRRRRSSLPATANIAPGPSGGQSRESGRDAAVEDVGAACAGHRCGPPFSVSSWQIRAALYSGSTNPATPQLPAAPAD